MGNDDTPTRRMHEICDIISSRRVHASDYVSEGIPFYRGKEIIEKANFQKVTAELFISPEKFIELSKKNGAPSSGDILLTSVGTLGVPYVVQAGEQFYFKDGNLTWFRNLRGVDSAYLRYWLLSPVGRAELKKCQIGSSQPAYTIVLLKDMEIALPPLPTQRKIAAILSAYDDLIENNTRRVRVLEQMARALYREWFVEYRFPGHEQAEWVEDEQGRRPAGWERGQLSDVLVNFRSSIKAGEKTAALPYVPIDELSTGSLGLQSFRPGEDAQSSLITFKKGDLLFGAMRPYLKKASIAPFDGVTRTTCFVFRPKRAELRSFGYLLASSQQAFDSANAGSRGTTIPYAVWDGSFENMHVLIPDKATLQRFEEICEPLLEQITLSIFRQRNLRQTRDLLLPRLVSGELDVSGLRVLGPGLEGELEAEGMAGGEE